MNARSYTYGGLELYHRINKFNTTNIISSIFYLECKLTRTNIHIYIYREREREEQFYGAIKSRCESVVLKGWLVLPTVKLGLTGSLGQTTP